MSERLLSESQVDWVGKPAPCELLCVGCSPEIHPLPAANAEVVDVAGECQWGPDKVSLNWGATMATLEAELSKRLTHRILFAGHTNVVSGTRDKLTIGLTLPGGQLQPPPQGAFIELLSKHSPRQGGQLSLVMLNGCESLQLATALRANGLQHVVCWRTIVIDGAARIFSRNFFKVREQWGTDPYMVILTPFVPSQSSSSLAMSGMRHRRNGCERVRRCRKSSARPARSHKRSERHEEILLWGAASFRVLIPSRCRFPIASVRRGGGGRRRRAWGLRGCPLCDIGAHT